MAHPQFTLTRGKNGKFYFNLTAKNGQVILASQGYASKASAQAGIKSVKASAKKDNLFERKTAKNGKYYFVLTSTNGQVVGKSEMYNSTSGRSNGIKSVATNAGPASVNDKA